MTRFRPRKSSPGSVFLLLLLLAVTSPVAGAMLAGLDCAVDCKDDDAGGRCLPGCAECACCPRVPVVFASLPALSTHAVRSQPLAEQDTVRLPSGRMGRIFRPPRGVSSARS